MIHGPCGSDNLHAPYIEVHIIVNIIQNYFVLIHLLRRMGLLSIGRGMMAEESSSMGRS